MKYIDPAVNTNSNGNHKTNIFYILFFVSSFYIILLRWLLSNFTVVKSDEQLSLLIPIDHIPINTVLFTLQVIFPVSILLLGYRRLYEYLNHGNYDVVHATLKRFLYYFPIVHIVLSFFKLIQVLNYFKFDKLLDLGAYSIYVKEGLVFPTFVELAAIGRSVVVSLILLAVFSVVQLSVETYRLDRKPSVKSVLRAVLEYVMLFVAFVAWFGLIWVKGNFGTIAVDQILFQLSTPLKGVNNDFVNSFVKGCLLPAFLLTIPVYLCYSFIKKNGADIRLNFLGTVKKIVFSSPALLTLLPITLMIGSVGYFLTDLGFIQYAQVSLTNSHFIEKNYRDPKEVQLIFPEKKRNLIYIFMESMETTYLSNDLGGFMGRNFIPELSEMAKDNISFSNSEQLGGAIQLPYTSWTIAAMVSQHAGIPLKISVEIGNDYGKYQSFLPGAYTLGDILHKQGYNQTLLVGSDADFGGRKDLYSQHGQFKILDLFTAREDGIIPPDYYVWWGYEDQKLYDYAKKELLSLSSQDNPFNLTMLTVDTHHVGGYYCSQCRNQYSTQYWNVQSCASRQIYAFMEWIKQQDFFENTTIVITGDHLSMDPLVSDMVENEDYERTTYNVFINSVKEPVKNHNRIFSTLDMFPTTLSSMGVSIQGDRLALGTDLFSNTPTLLEEKGVEAVSNGLYGFSKLYDSIMQGSSKDVKEEEVSK